MASRVVTRSRGQQQPEQPEQPRARWTVFLTKMLADLIVDQVRKGNRPNNTFTKKAWKLLCDEFYKKTGLKWDKEQLKNRYGVLRRQYVVMKSLLDRGDFTWNETTGAVVAEEDAWNKYIEEHPDAEAIRTSGCPIYKQLCEIFMEPVTNGKHDQSSELEIEISSLTLPNPLLHRTKVECASEYEAVFEVADDRDTVQPTSPNTVGNRKRGRRGIDDAIASAILEMASASKLRAAALKQLTSRYPIADCIRELDQIHGLEERVYFSALDLFNNPKARETFLSLKNNKRMAWLQWKCPTSCNTLS